MPDPIQHVRQYFAYAHLPEELKAISRPYRDLADRLITSISHGPELTVALRKLLESKDAAVRAALPDSTKE